VQKSQKFAGGIFGGIDIFNKKPSSEDEGKILNLFQQSLSY